MVDKSKSGSIIETRRTRGIVRWTGRIIKEMESGGIAEELRELRKVIEKMVIVLKKLARGLERREDGGQESTRGEVRSEREGVEIKESGGGRREENKGRKKRESRR